MRYWALAFGLVVSSMAIAAAPDGFDPALAPWFQDLQRPDTQSSCCDVADCRPVGSRVQGDHYQALVEGLWLDIPNNKIINPKSNPTGRAVLCMAPGRPDLIYCFVRPVEV